jgi:putative transcriptional regulator
MTHIARYHPEFILLQEFVQGSLPMGINVAVSSHVEACSVCGQKVDQLLSEAGDNWQQHEAIEYTDDMASIADKILNDDALPIQSSIPDSAERKVQIAGRDVQLPQLLADIYSVGLTWKTVAKGIQQALIDLDSETVAKFVYMEPGSRVPRHSHMGNEFMLVLEGALSDELGDYQELDFVARDPQHTHAQTTVNGCVCLFITDAPLRFSDGLLRFMNPINSLLTWLKKP